MRPSFIMTLIAATTIATVAFAQMAPTKTGDSAKGKVLTNDKGMTLYVFDKDFRRQVDLQWAVRRQLAALDGNGGCHADERLQRHHPPGRQQAVGL